MRYELNRLYNALCILRKAIAPRKIHGRHLHHRKQKKKRPLQNCNSEAVKPYQKQYVSDE